MDARRLRPALIGAVVLVVLAAVSATAVALSSINFREFGASPVAAGDGPSSIVAADLDGDSDQDLAIANRGSDDVTVLRNKGGGRFTEANASPATAGDGPSSIVAADLDGDSDQDLAIANLASDDVTILRNKGSGGFNQPGFSPEAVGDEPSSLDAADLDGDGDQDLAVANAGDDDVTILRNGGSGNLTRPDSSPEPVGSVPKSVIASDLDGDGAADLAVADSAENKVTVLRHAADEGSLDFPTVERSDWFDGGAEPVAIAAADTDADGDLDLNVADRESTGIAGEVATLRNKGAANFGTHRLVPVGILPGGIAAADFDGDQDPDLATPNSGSDDVSIRRNDASFFNEDRTEGAGVGPSSIATADIDGDGDSDLAVANADSDNVTLLRNKASSP